MKALPAIGSVVLPLFLGCSATPSRWPSESPAGQARDSACTLASDDAQSGPLRLATERAVLTLEAFSRQGQRELHWALTLPLPVSFVKTASLLEDGSVVVLGYTHGSGWREDAFPGRWIARIDPTGTIAWERNFGPNARLFLEALSATPRGRVLLASRFGDLLILDAKDGSELVRQHVDNAPADNWTSLADGGGTLYVSGVSLSRYSDDGALQWSTDQGVYAMDCESAAGPDNGMVFAGTNMESQPVWVSRHDRQGNRLWTRTLGRLVERCERYEESSGSGGWPIVSPAVYALAWPFAKLYSLLPHFRTVSYYDPNPARLSVGPNAQVLVAYEENRARVARENDTSVASLLRADGKPLWHAVLGDPRDFGQMEQAAVVNDSLYAVTSSRRLTLLDELGRTSASVCFSDDLTRRSRIAMLAARDGRALLVRSVKAADARR